MTCVQRYAKNRSILEGHSNCSIVINHLCSNLLQVFFNRDQRICVTLSVLQFKKKIQIKNSQLLSLIETWGFHEDTSLMTRTKIRSLRRRRRSRTTRMTTRRPRRTTRRRTMTITKLSSVLPFWNHKLKPN